MIELRLIKKKRQLCIVLSMVLLLGNVPLFAQQHELGEPYQVFEDDESAGTLDPAGQPADEFAAAGGDPVLAVSSRGGEEPRTVIQSVYPQTVLQSVYPGSSRAGGQGPSISPTAWPPSGGGAGTSASDPYVIMDADDLADLATNVNNGAIPFSSPTYFALGDDIDLSAIPNWTPIGDFNQPFKGIFDGRNYKITNLTLYNTADEDQGLFGYCDTATIKNLTLEGADITGAEFTGGICSFARQSILENLTVRDSTILGDKCVGGIAGQLNTCTVSNLTVEGNGWVRAVDTPVFDDDYGLFVGGITGYNAETSVEYAEVKVPVGVAGMNWVVGGIAGTVREREGYANSGGTLSNCTVYSHVAGAKYVGGIAGTVEYDSVATNCVTETSARITATEDYAYAGGIVGLLRSFKSSQTAKILYCTNNAAVGMGDPSGQSTIFGGIAGAAVNQTDIRYCENYGDVVVYGYAGGIAGNVNAEEEDYEQPPNPTPGTQRYVRDCANFGNVSAVNNYAGGIAGRSSDSSILRNYNTGRVHTGNMYAGGIAGLHSTSAYIGSVNINQCFNTGAIHSEGNQAGGIAGYVRGEAASASYAYVRYSYNTGTVNGRNVAGGIAGGVGEYGNLLYCYNLGDVAGGSYIGGVVGNHYQDSAEIRNCIAVNENIRAENLSTAGRIYGVNTNNISTRNNAAWEGVHINGCIQKGTEMSRHGADRTADEIKVWGSTDTSAVWYYFHNGNSYWQIEGSNDLPTLTSITAAQPIDSSYLQDRHPVSATLAGSGAQNDPYQIHSAADLLLFSRWIRGNDPRLFDYFRLEADIDMTGVDWASTGVPNSANAQFKGHLDGNGKTIRNLTIGAANYESAGLFGTIGTVGGPMTASVRDLTLENCYIVSAQGRLGGLAGSISYGEVENVHVTGYIEADTAMSSVGGLAGNISATTVADCSIDMTVLNPLAGSSTNVFTGGLAGSAGNNSAIKGCIVKGSVTGKEDVGGVAGIVSYGSSYIEDCIVYADVQGDINVGGIAGLFNADYITTSYVAEEATILSGTRGNLGGLAGRMGNTAAIKNCYSLAAIEGRNVSNSYRNRVGGLIGTMETGTTLENCYAASPAFLGGGGMVGTAESGTLIKNSAVLNHALTGNASAARVASFQSAGTLQNNYAWAGSQVNGVLIESSDKTHNHGKDMWPAQFRYTDFWKDELFFNDTVWFLEDGALPVFIGNTGQKDTVPAHLKAETLLVTPQSITLRPGESITLQTEVLPAYAYDTSVAFVSSDSQGASVDKNGTITGRRNGFYVITATAGNAQERVLVTVNSGGSSGGGGGGSSSGIMATVTVQCIDEISHILSAWNISRAIDDQVTISAPEIEGYRLLGDSSIVYTVKSSGNTVTFRYKKINLLHPGQETELEEARPITHAAYISGYPDGTFRPDNPMTRAEAAAILYNLTDSETAALSDELDFTDVDSSAWYYDAVMELVQRGVISGYPGGSFAPENTITRAEFTVMALKFAGIAPVDGDISFPDVDMAHWAAAFIQAAVQDGILSGYPDGTFQPNNAVTRAEVVSILNVITGRTDCNISDGKTFTDLAGSHWAYEMIINAATDHVHE